MTWRTEAPYLIYNVIVIIFLSGGYFSDTSGIQPPGRLSSVENISGRAPAFCTRGKQMLAAPHLLPQRKISSCRARPPPPLQAANRRPASATSRQTTCNRPGLPSRRDQPLAAPPPPVMCNPPVIRPLCPVGEPLRPHPASSSGGEQPLGSNLWPRPASILAANMLQKTGFLINASMAVPGPCPPHRGARPARGPHPLRLHSGARPRPPNDVRLARKTGLR